MEPGSDLVRASARVSAVTAVARGLGFARWIVFGLTVGATHLGNVYQTANWVPNILYELAAGGVLSWVFVPTFLAEMDKGTDRADLVVSTIGNLLLLISIPVVAAGIFLAGPIMRGFTIGVADPAVRAKQIEIGAWFLRLFLPQVPLYMAGMVMRGALHAGERLVLPAAAPAFASLFMIASYVAFAVMGAHNDVFDVTFPQRLVLGLGATIGVAAWCLAQLQPMLKMGVRWKPVLALRDPVVRKALRSCGHGVSFYVITEIGYVTTLVLANRVKGGVVAFQLAYAFFELPNALIGFPVSMAVLPALARRAPRDEEGFARLLSSSLRTTAVLLLPAAAGLAATAGPLTQLIFSRAGSDVAPELVRSALVPLAVGLPAFALTQALSRGCYAMHRAAPPVAFNAVTVGLYMAVSIPATVIAAPRSTAALSVLTLAYSAGLWAGAVLAVWMVSRMVPRWKAAPDVRVMTVMALRAAVMATAVLAAAWLARPAGTLGRLGAGIATGAVVYAALSARVPEVRTALRGLRGRAAA